MNWVDIVVGVFMILFLVAGTRKGLIREVTGFVGLVVAFVVGIVGARVWAVMIADELRFHPSVATAVSFILIFVLVFLLFRAAGSVIFKFIRRSPLGLLDRLGGSVIGLLKGGLIISLVFLILGTFSLPQALSKTLDSSALVPPLRAFAPTVYNLFKAAFPQMRSLGEVVGQSVESGLARGKEKVLEKSSDVVDMLQKTKTTADNNSENRPQPDEGSAEGE